MDRNEDPYDLLELGAILDEFFRSFLIVRIFIKIGNLCSLSFWYCMPVFKAIIQFLFYLVLILGLSIVICGMNSTCTVIGAICDYYKQLRSWPASRQLETTLPNRNTSSNAENNPLPSSTDSSNDQGSSQHNSESPCGSDHESWSILDKYYNPKLNKRKEVRFAGKVEEVQARPDEPSRMIAVAAISPDTKDLKSAS